MTRHGLKPWLVEQARRYLPPDEARARSRAGYELASAIVAARLAGEPVDLPPAPVEPADLVTVQCEREDAHGAHGACAGYVGRAGVPAGPPPWTPGELTGCRVCHRPHDAPPDTVCDRCDDTGRRS